MIIDINETKFINSGLNCNQWIYLSNSVIGECFPNTIHIGEIRDLESKGYIKILDDECSNIVVKTKAIDLFELKGDSSLETMFKTFWNTYPQRVGARILRSKDTTTREASEIKRKMLPYLKVEGNFDKIMKGLQNELNLRKKDNSLLYMQMISTYCNQRTWEKYYDLEEDKPVERVESI